MQAVLNQLNTLAGVVGCMVYDTEGQVLVHSFPTLFDSDSLAGAAGVLLNGAAGLETAAGKISMLDLRFGESRIVVRPITGANLLMLCTAQANLQFLNISVGMAIAKIEKLVVSQKAHAKPAAQTAAPPEFKTGSERIVPGREGELKGKAAIKMGASLGEKPGENPALDLDKMRHRLSELVYRGLGPDGEEYTIRIEQARTKKDLQQVVGKCRDIMRQIGRKDIVRLLDAEFESLN